MGLGALDGSHAAALAAATAALKHPAAGVREAALQVLPRTAESLAAIVAAHDRWRIPICMLGASRSSRIADMPAIARGGPRRSGRRLQDEVNVKDLWLRRCRDRRRCPQRSGFPHERGKS